MLIWLRDVDWFELLHNRDSLVVLAFVGVSVALLVVVVVNLVNRVLVRYRQKYVESTDFDLRELLLQFSSEDVFIVSVLLALITFAFALVLTRSVVGLVYATFAAFCAFFVPRLYLRYARNKRKETLNLQMIDALNLMSGSLAAGQTFERACEVIVQEMSPPISQEFGILVHEWKMGKEMELALRNLAFRSELEDFELFVSAVISARKSGGNIREIFQNIARTIRDRINLEQKVNALTSQGKMQAIVMGIMPAAIGFAFYKIDPELMRPLFTTPLGIAVLVVVVILEIAAYKVSKKITTIDV